MIKISSILVTLSLALFIHSCHGFDLDTEDETELINEPRIFTSILNSTTTFSPASILAAILVGILIVLAFGPALLNNNGQAYDRNYYNQQEQDNFAYVKTDRRSLDEVPEHSSSELVTKSSTPLCSNMKSTLVIGFVLLALSNYAYADPLDIVDEADEDRTITTNNGNILLNFNATNIVFIAAVIGIGLIALVALAAVFAAPGASSGYSGYQNRFSNNQGQYNDYYDEQPLHYQKRSVSDVAHQLYALAEAFKKYEVEESCQKYVACASRRNTESYALMNIVDDVMKAMLKSGHEKVRAKDAYVGELIDAYLQGERTSCQQHKSICYRKKFN